MKGINHNISIESNSQAIELGNMDRYRYLYKVKDHDLYFISPSLHYLEQNRDFLVANSKKKLLDAKYKMKPDYLSYEEYNTVTWYYILLYINNCFNCEDFIMTEVIVPEKYALYNLVERYQNQRLIASDVSYNSALEVQYV